MTPSNRRKLLTLRDAANYITKLPKAEHAAPRWQAAMEALILVAESVPRSEPGNYRISPNRRDAC
jgi:hypothetical protein